MDYGETGQIADHAAVLDVWNDYRDGIYEGDVARLERIFHSSASMFYVSGNNVVATPIADYLNIVRDRAIPRSVGAERSERLVALSIPSIDSAVLTATILIMGKSYTDQLVLLKAQGKWTIVTKTYHLDHDVLLAPATS